jgi:hypothetical protein
MHGWRNISCVNEAEVVLVFQRNIVIFSGLNEPVVSHTLSHSIPMYLTYNDARRPGT